MHNCFQSQVNIATFNINFNIFFEAWLIVFLVNKFFNFINIKVSCQKIVKVSINKLYLNYFVKKQ